LTIAGVADTHTALWHLFDDKRLSAAAEGFINDAATARRKIAISTISLAEVVYLVEKNRLPASAYDELTQALADPSTFLQKPLLVRLLSRPCGKCHAPKYRTCQTAWWRQRVSILMCQLSAVTDASAPPT
jgi:predicted nucleic acid-binding protein